MGFFLTIFAPDPFQGQIPYPLGLFQRGAQFYICVTFCDDWVSGESSNFQAFLVCNIFHLEANIAKNSPDRKYK